MDPRLATAITIELRSFVREGGARRLRPATCHVGHPGGEQVRLPHVQPAETSLRADLVERALDGLSVIDGVCAWVTRSGDLTVTDADAQWFAAARIAFERYGLRLTDFFVVNRSGWVERVSGEQRQWSRVRRSDR